MEPREAALLLLCCRLGDEAVPLTAAEYRQLAQRVQQSTCTAPETELTSAHLRALGYDAPMRVRILTLLDRRELPRRPSGGPGPDPHLPGLSPAPAPSG